MEQTVEKYIKDYPFLQYINEPKGNYKHAKDAGYDDPDDLFLKSINVTPIFSHNCVIVLNN